MRLEDTLTYRCYLCLAWVCGTLRDDRLGSDGPYDDSDYFNSHIVELFGDDIDQVFLSQSVLGVFGKERWAFTDPANNFTGDDLGARLFHDRDYDLYYLVNRPTQGVIVDFITDGLTVAGMGTPDKFQQAAQLVENVRPKYRARVVLAGLSLGGALSAYAAMQASWRIRTVLFDPLGMNRSMMGASGLRPFGNREVLSDRFRLLDGAVDWYFIEGSWVAELNVERHLSSVGTVWKLSQDPMRATNKMDTHDYRHVRFGLHRLWNQDSLWQQREAARVRSARLQSGINASGMGGLE
jgi:pimeloyl-ACP methyl ester carboxylesterase